VRSAHPDDPPRSAQHVFLQNMPEVICQKCIFTINYIANYLGRTCGNLYKSS
jgi:hypothetical protein